VRNIERLENLFFDGKWKIIFRKDKKYELCLYKAIKVINWWANVRWKCDEGTKYLSMNVRGLPMESIVASRRKTAIIAIESNQKLEEISR
jgi:hypothetical protein